MTLPVRSNMQQLLEKTQAKENYHSPPNRFQPPFQSGRRSEQTPGAYCRNKGGAGKMRKVSRTDGNPVHYHHRRESEDADESLRPQRPDRSGNMLVMGKQTWKESVCGHL